MNRKAAWRRYSGHHDGVFTKAVDAEVQRALQRRATAGATRRYNDGAELTQSSLLERGEVILVDDKAALEKEPNR